MGHIELQAFLNPVILDFFVMLSKHGHVITSCGEGRKTIDCKGNEYMMAYMRVIGRSCQTTESDPRQR